MDGIVLRERYIAPPVNGSPCRVLIAGATRPTSARFSGIAMAMQASWNQLMILAEFAV